MNYFHFVDTWPEDRKQLVMSETAKIAQSMKNITSTLSAEDLSQLGDSFKAIGTKLMARLSASTLRSQLFGDEDESAQDFLGLIMKIIADCPFVQQTIEYVNKEVK